MQSGSTCKEAAILLLCVSAAAQNVNQLWVWWFHPGITAGRRKICDTGVNINIISSFLTIRCYWNLPHCAFNLYLFVTALSFKKQPTLLDKHKNTGRRPTTRWRQTATDVSWRVSCFALQPELGYRFHKVIIIKWRALYTNSFKSAPHDHQTVNIQRFGGRKRTIYYHVYIRTQIIHKHFPPLPKASLSATHLV